MKGYYGIVKRTKITHTPIPGVHTSVVTFELMPGLFARRFSATLNAKELSTQFPSHDDTEIQFHVVLGIT